MPSTADETRDKGPSRIGAAVRAIVPAIPLGIALLHGAIAHEKPATARSLVPQRLSAPSLQGCDASVPCPMAAKGHPVMWWFVFKLNAKSFPECGGGTRACPFGGQVQTGPTYSKFGQHYVVASSDATSLQDGLTDCLGTTINDPVGASFDEVYNGNTTM